MTKYKHLSDKLHQLEREIESALKQEIEKSTVMSKHISNQKALLVNGFGHEELINLQGSLIFLDRNGYHYSFDDSDYTNDDLIDILNQIQ